jgi:hypothetical protein
VKRMQLIIAGRVRLNRSNCRSPFEKSQFLPDRNVTACPVDMTLLAGGHTRRETASLPHAGPGWRGQGPKPALAGARSAALEAVARAQHHRAAVRTGRTAYRQSRP